VPDNERGWKDVVLVRAAQGAGNPGSVKIIKPFLDFADSTYPYMYHCHILEHEDRGMMGQYIVVVTTTLDTTSIERTNNENLETHIFPNPVNNQQTQRTSDTNVLSE
jgi:bilirubin oxidase